ncbi:hypothetical protein [Phyllobacterium sp. SB3]|uniref:hypothetical protein n=1 Tax=Phyllobacterium sp. SB3 TaxID=3156073 RepID=UPI0032AECC06
MKEIGIIGFTQASVNIRKFIKSYRGNVNLGAATAWLGLQIISRSSSSMDIMFRPWVVQNPAAIPKRRNWTWTRHTPASW